MPWVLEHDDKIVMVGDSITSIVADPPRFWWKLLQETAEGTLGNLRWVDSGQGSRGMSWFVGQEALYVTSHNPDALCIALGINDANQGRTVGQFEADYNSFLDTVFAWKPMLKVALAGPWISGTLVPNGSNAADALVDSFRDVVKGIATARGLPYFDFRQDAEDNWDPALTYDGVHPSILGAERLSTVALANTTLDTTADPMSQTKNVVELRAADINLRATGTATISAALTGKKFRLDSATVRCKSKTGTLGTSPQLKIKAGAAGAVTMVAAQALAFADGVDSVLEMTLPSSRYLADIGSNPLEAEVTVAATGMSAFTCDLYVKGAWV